VEGETQVLDLDDTDPTIFGIFVNWLYMQTIINEEGQLPSCENCINLWILADRLLVPKLQNDALTALDQGRVDQKGIKCFAPETFHRVWDNTTEDSMLRNYLVNSLVETKYGNVKSPEHYPHGMLVAMINAMRAKDMGRTLGKEHFWKPSTVELEKYFVPEDVEGRETVRRDPPTSGSASRDKSGE
jgi:hypothetical protein